MPEVYALLGVTQHNISQHLENFFSQTDTIPENSREQLRAAGVIPSGRGRPPRLVTKEEFQFLMVRATLNVASIYDTPDTRKVINVLRNILGEGLALVK